MHPSNEQPQLSRQFFYLPLQQTLLLTVDPFMMKTAASVRGHDLSERKCYLRDERQLRFYKQYTTHNCRVECLTNFTLAQCGCVKFSMPRQLIEFDFL